MVAFSKQFERKFVATGRRFRRHLATGSRAVWDKEILRVGVWTQPHWPHPWNVTLSTLVNLKRQFDLATSRGNRFPVVWNHEGMDPRDNRNAVGYLQKLWIAGTRLFARFWTDDELATRKLSTGVDDVSVLALPTWTDGFGNTYGEIIGHLGLVTLPVIPGQLPAVRVMSLHPYRGAAPMTIATNIVPDPVADAARLLATKKPADGTGDGSSADGGDETMIAVSELVALLRESGQEIPEEVKTANEFRIAWKTLNPASGDTADAGTTDAGTGAGGTADLSQTAPPDYAAMRTENETLRRQLSTFQLQQKVSYEGKVNGLIASGRVAPAMKDSLLESGRLSGYQLATLTPFDAIPAQTSVPTQSKAKGLATATPPAVDTKKSESYQLTDEEVKKQKAEVYPSR